jgi:hypothetical protein
MSKHKGNDKLNARFSQRKQSLDRMIMMKSQFHGLKKNMNEAPCMWFFFWLRYFFKKACCGACGCDLGKRERTIGFFYPIPLQNFVKAFTAFHPDLANE